MKTKLAFLACSAAAAVCSFRAGQNSDRLDFDFWAYAGPAVIFLGISILLGMALNTEEPK